MPKPKHPLAGDEKWIFAQPDVGFSTHYVSVHQKTEEREVRSISNVATCREGLVHNIRNGLQGGLCLKVSTGANEWEFRFQQVKDVDLEDPAAKEAGMTAMRIQRTAFTQKVLSKKLLGQFVQVADIVAGPVCVLLSNRRPEGEWWRTPIEKVLVENYIHWYGSDNFFLQHPVLVSLVSALYRQVALLCRAGRAKEIIKAVDYKQVEECLSSGDYKLALEIINQTRPWIEVPAGKNGNEINYPFPEGHWRRLKCLQRGRRRHGYPKLLGQDFGEGWDLLSKATQWTGMYSFWGPIGSRTDRHRQLVELGKLIKRKENGDKSVPSLT